VTVPIDRSRQHLEAVMLRHDDDLVHGDDAAHCGSRFSAQDYRGATPADRSTFRKWIFGVVVFYSALLLAFGVFAVVIDQGLGLTRLTSLSIHGMAAVPRSN
jgi:hypothetical protein